MALDETPELDDTRTLAAAARLAQSHEDADVCLGASVLPPRTIAAVALLQPDFSSVAIGATTSPLPLLKLADPKQQGRQRASTGP